MRHFQDAAVGSCNPPAICVCIGRKRMIRDREEGKQPTSVAVMINRESSRNFYTRRLCMVYEPRAASDGTAALRPSVEGLPRRRRGAASSKKSFVRATRNARLRSRRNRTKPPRARVVRSPRPLRHPREYRSASSPPRRSRRHARARVSFTHIAQSLESPSS